MEDDMLDDATLRTKRLGLKELPNDSVHEISRAKAVRASYAFWSTGNEALLEQAFAETFAEHAAPPLREPATNGMRTSPRRRAPEDDAK
jgi:hypothetical protein